MIKHFSNEIYQQQLIDKTRYLKQLFSEFDFPRLAVYESPISHYRMRSEFRIWHDGEDLYHIMYDKQTKKRIRIDDFPAGSLLINKTMQVIIPLLQYNEILRHLLFQIDYLSTLSDKILVTMLYHKTLNEEWHNQAENLVNELRKQDLNVHIVGRATKQKIILDVDYVDEELMILDKTLIYRQYENSFTQPNAFVNIKMLEWAVSSTKLASGDLLEFYCGNGNFSVALAQNFKKVLATEIAKISVRAAQYNIQLNNINNLNVIRLSAEEFSLAINKERKFNRLSGIHLDDYQCKTVLVDPPRSGLDSATLNIIKNYKKIIYISCNPMTLRNNLFELCKTHKMVEFAMFDQFPYTDHIETAVVLGKR